MEPADFEFAFDFADESDFGEYLQRLDEKREGVGLDPGKVPSTYLIAEVDGSIVGRVSIRHELNEELLRNGGHIGYGVLPGARRRGYATEMLRQALPAARRLGIERALLTVDETNEASIRVIERCGGELEPRAPGDPEGGMLRYWVGTG